ncbi:metalloendopeptidase OMA1, mitochondrial-like isoform X2 [Ischnura elegans]|nr:metalloendopeptidase OMA1, mitochondrial-like isoform X2 [Ischnura elegans]XP_046384234.1 metalloendopeptidase OMA1, mitochondrial-like isoform X2 [Ischnura elegans]
MLLQISDIQNKFLQNLHDTKMLPPNSLAYIKVDRIVKSILEKNQDIPEVRDVPWSVHVINDPLHRNVFVLPDGSIYVFTGILDVCKNDDQLAFVLAHEISHVVMSHVEENISRGYCMELFILMPIILFWATMPIELAIVSHWLTNRMNHFMITLPFCRRTEMEADYVALQLIAKACFDVRESSKFWNNMVKNSVKDAQIPPAEWLSTHPQYAKREKLLNDLMPAAIRLRQFHKCPPLRDDRW